MNIKKVVNSGIVEDALKGITKVRTLEFPVKALRKDKHEIKKLPHLFEFNKEMEENFKQDYNILFKKLFLDKLNEILKQI